MERKKRIEMKHLKNFSQMFEAAGDGPVEAMLKRIEKKDTKALVSALMPYKHLLKPYYDKYYRGGEIRADLIEADIRKLNFTAKANEEYGWDEDYADDRRNPMILRILYKVFVRFPKSVVSIIADWFKDMIYSFRSGDIRFGIARLLVGAVTAFLVFLLGLFAYQCGDWLFNGLDKGVAKGGARFEPAHYETHVHRVHSGKSSYTYVTHDYVPDRWHVDVQGIGEESHRVEQWTTYDRQAGDGVWKGDTLVNDENWTWDGTEEY
jgi:hypothetical protein